MSGELGGMYDVFRNLLETSTPTEAVKQLEILGVDDERIQRIREFHEHQLLSIKEMEEPRVAVNGNRETWYTGPRENDRAWPAIQRELERSGWGPDAIEDLDSASTRVVSLLNHPKEPDFSTRGLVVGYVQSGKTTNFTSVMAKAADRGYKLFIVLAGIHNGLRRQTQARLAQQLVESNPTSWSQLTGLDRDFVPTENAASFFGGSNSTHVLCVVKKNATVLRKFALWLESASDYLQQAPALVIDDEADQASVATTSINPLILRILDTLPKAAYVGYTATPFANVLIDPAAKDLYPSDFIVNLPQPKAHFGTEVLFGRYALDGEDPEDVDDGYDMIRSVPAEDVPLVSPSTRADADGFTPEITDTLEEAVQYFWLTSAARRVRGTGNKHATMLIHTSMRIQVHNSFRIPLKKIRAHTLDHLDDPGTLRRLRTLWDEETARVAAEDFGETKVPFDTLLEELPGVIGDCRIIMDNSDSEDTLDYDNGPVVAIAVGGNKFSRGLTLEGLAVTYFVRAASAYDTLLQMGRWFGFRHGYADLPRVWMTDELHAAFRHLATVEADMRRDIDVYLHENETPQTFAVRLRTHPVLRVTAAAKMQSAIRASAAYGGRRIQTRYFHTRADWLRDNQNAARDLVRRAVAEAVTQDSRPEDGRHILHGVPHTDVLDFLSRYRFHESSQECDAALISSYVRRRVQQGSLLRWNVAIVGNRAGDTDTDFTFAPDIAVGRITRARLQSPTGEPDFADIKTLMSRADATVDLVDVPRGLEEDEIKRERRKQLPDTGLLVLYPIDKDSRPSELRKKSREPLDAEDHVIGIGLVFPEPRQDSAVDWDGSYISADLSGIRLEDTDDEDLRTLEGEDAA
ncbi:Z1 domain-containing protein [Streptomyces sp. NBC_01381]|uniref:Z1 domain-containing protein n=1 Tax=Streptomyces sp. NBC_01381 TaxID=2903845 RepID=UPI00225600A2|nr:Z1 domain-containing protein [Streptomyces sp. NBC_01381]MCX4666992.1 Z1 domain-containing protein [Streptomyces sp. NBC_01381]